jgi:hypothetical protein
MSSRQRTYSLLPKPLQEIGHHPDAQSVDVDKMQFRIYRSATRILSAGECDSLAVKEAGETPWTGYPIGECPESELGVVKLEPDHGENLVYIAGAKCWRRYRFGGWNTRGDAFDCGSFEEFRELHWVDGGSIHTFNVAQPDGVSSVGEWCQGLIDRYEKLTSLRESFDEWAEQSSAASGDVDPYLQKAADRSGRTESQGT